MDRLLIENIPITPSIGYCRLRVVGNKVNSFHLNIAIENYINSMFQNGQQIYNPNEKVKQELFNVCEQEAPEYTYIIDGLVNIIECFHRF